MTDLDLTPEQRAQFNAGKKIFAREFEPKDGLGPLFNSVSCAECHEAPVLGGTGDEGEDALPLVVTATLVISFLATLSPARRAARLEPVEVLRYE